MRPVDIYKRITKAFSEGDMATATELIAEDVVWHTDDNQTTVPSEFRGREAFFAAAGTPKDAVTEWEVIPHVVVGDDKSVFSHQIDRFVLKDGTELVVHFLLHMQFNDKGQIQEVWEFGQSAIPH